MVNILFSLISFYFFLGPIYAQEASRALIKIEKSGKDIRVFSISKGKFIPTIPGNKEIINKLSLLNSGAEAFVSGYIDYEHFTSGDSHRMMPYFIIQEIYPVSLKDLGSDAQQILDLESIKPLEFPSLVYAPAPIYVSTEVASAITMTSSLLLMNELTSGNDGTEKDLRTMLFFSAGTMATLMFIYDQFEGSKKK